jgi:SWI/SNF-related matrix-associated actin-dependent regulator 1 of chromatin subfamily A
MKLTYIAEKITNSFRGRTNTYDGYYKVSSTYQEKDVVKSAGFWWNPGMKSWWTPFEKTAAKLADVADDTCKTKLMALKNEHEEALEASRATDADIEIPVNEGLEYLPFQKAGIAYSADHRNILIADEMGLGKTIQALGIINLDPTMKKVLCVVPASLKLNWEREAKKWLVRETDISVINSKDGWVDGDLVIINYDILKKFHDEIHARDWDLLVCDEAHYMKNNKAQRTKEIVGWYDKRIKKVVSRLEAERKVFLTGTPIVNRPIELWPLINYLAPKTFKYFMSYAKRYTKAHHNGYGWDFTGASNLEELQDKLRTTIMIRRLKKEVLTELPPKFRQVIEIPANGFSGLIRKEQDLIAKNQEVIDELRMAVEIAKASDNPEDYKNAVAALQQGMAVAFGDMSRVRHEVALAKVDVVVEHLKGIIEDEEQKVVCFAHHRDVIEKIKEAFGDEAVILYGGMTDKKKDESVERFQNDDKVKLFIGSIQAAGVGLTLTASSRVVFAELDWVPGNMTQAEDRTHRIGQVNNVLVQHIVLQGSMDAEMAHKLVAKQNVIDKALDEKPEPIVVTPGNPTATGGHGYDRIGKIANKMTDDQRQAVHVALQRLAMVCDGARELDGHGFNAIDTRLGKSLAANATLTPRQAALGKLIVTKYHGQLGDEMIKAIKGE